MGAENIITPRMFGNTSLGNTAGGEGEEEEDGEKGLGELPRCAGP